MNGEIKRVVVVGGGTAGWLAACHLAKQLEPSTNRGISVTLVDSPDIPTIGVGEGTVPVMRDTLKYFGISEVEFIKRCDVTFKQSIKFVDWEVAPRDGHSTYYHHLFDFPNIRPFNPTPYWLSNNAINKTHFADLVSVQSHVCELGLAPKLNRDGEFSGLFNYAYHLDAGKFTQMLSEHGTAELGISNIKANVERVHLNDGGEIIHLETDSAGVISGDMFVDCTGFKAMLIEKSMGAKFIDKSDVLLTDTALAIQIPYEDENTPIPPFTISTAQKHGWIWDIGLTQRKGVGYVFSSDHQSEDQAVHTLAEYLGQSAAQIEPRKISMKVGYQKQAWIKNCVAMGLSQGFVEPLEATGLLMFDVTARMFSEALPDFKEDMPLRAKRFNEDICQMWESTSDFIKLHYYLSKREDSQFWVDNRDPQSISTELAEKLQMWQRKLPSQFDFRHTVDSFRVSNYLYVLYGMNFNTELNGRYAQYHNVEAINKLRTEIEKGVKYCKSNLLSHREYLEKVRKLS
ncbi:tryptophan 7-halogenase [Pseudoalteromonas luteoviolacea]|uniref:tryptophan halogenase family protein n=1 Tax=Pseudoalteromonas luteoviolacea TaxID=43657 RepID=UPI001B35AE35|nr:tryptophan halogenase family protein [Pseudoalteromonas luteoviolacea]MBQ4809985.1 tryptophan 7-halogenase [Pseudoalteromonas luteoviolacea]